MNLYFVIQPRLIESDLDRRLQGYVDDVNRVFAKNTNRRFAYGGYELGDELPEAADGIVVKTVYHFGDNAGGTECKRGGMRFISNSCMADQAGRGLGWSKVWPRSPMDVRSYASQLGDLIHELEHVFGAGIGEYYSFPRFEDRTGVGPDANIPGVTDEKNLGHDFWAARQDWLTDPLLAHHPYGLPGFGTTHESILSHMKLSDAAAAVVDRDKGMTREELGFHESRLRVTSGGELIRARVMIWNVWPQPQDYTLLVDEDVEGELTFDWDAHRAKGEVMLIVKAFPHRSDVARLPSRTWYTLFDAQKQMLVGGLASPMIEIDCAAYPWGDVNMDGTATISDAVSILRHRIGLAAFTEEQELLADVSGDGTPSAYDAGLVLKQLMAENNPPVTAARPARPRLTSGTVTDLELK